MEVQFGPNSVDEPNLLYKLQRKIKVFNTSNHLPNRGYNLVASSSKYALVFVGVPDGTLSVYQLNQLVDAESEPQHLSVKLQESPTHIAVSCDYELLAVTGGQLLSIFRITDFQHSNVAPSLVIKTEVNSANFVSALQWNPWKDYADSIAIAFYDGTLFAYTAGSGQIKRVPAKARCICWSPKGKQLVTGNSDGTLSQYKPDLTHVKTFAAPNLFEGAPIEALAVYWIATYQFAVVYRNAADNSRPAVTIVNTSKTGQGICLNYEDVCYSLGSNRPWYYYLQALAEWKVILASSSNSMEIATLGSADGANWLQWCQATDETRAELPLTNKTQETYPVGLSIDTCAIHQLPWGENEMLPFMPLLHVISHSGLLTIFNIVNLNREAQAKNIMIQPQQLALPAASLTSIIPDDAPQEPGPVPGPNTDIKPQAIPAPQAGIFTSSVPTPTSDIRIPSFTPTQQIAVPTPQVPEQRQEEVKPVPQQPVPQAAAVQQVQPKPQAPPTKSQQVVDQENAAIKAEQDRINKIKANEDIKNMLIKEVNDFQMELYNFMVKTRETQARIQRDIDSINSNFNFNSLDSEQFKKDCSVEDLRSAVVQLKLELVRACAVVAEARTHSDAKDFHEWTQADPLTTKRVASVKKLAYYVQTQLDQAHKALDYKWNELASKDPQYKCERRMIRPILDDVYQPLVKQQEILSRQEAVLRTLRKTLNECDVGPVFKSTSLLRNTPFKKDPLSKLTKNILNMSIEPKSPRANQSLLTPQKLDALRDALSNHKPIKIKPVNVELRQHLANLKMNYEKSMRDKAAQQIKVKEEPEIVSEQQMPIKDITKIEPQEPIKIEAKIEPPKQEKPVPTFTPVPNVQEQPPNVVRTLFTDEPKQERQEPVIQPAKPQPVIQPSFSKPQVQPSIFSQQLPQSPTNTKSVLKDLLQNKSQANLEAKNDASTFMGQKICSPTAFGQPTSAQPSPSNTFTAKPIADISNMFNQLPPQTFAAELKPQISNVKSSETGEILIESTDTPKTLDLKPKEKPMTNLFGMKSTTPPVSTSNVPDVLKTSIPDKKPEIKVTVKPLDKLKENVPEKTSETSKTVKAPEKKDAVKPFGVQGTNKSFFFGATSGNSTNSSPTTDKPLDLKAEAKATTSIKPATPKVSEATIPDSSAPVTITESKPVDASKVPIKSVAPTTSSDSSSSISSIVSKPQQVTVQSESLETLTSNESVKAVSSSAASIFSSAVASQPKTTGSIFSSTSTVFGTTTGTSIFGSPTKNSAFGGSIFSSNNVASAFGQTSPQISTASTASSIFAAAVATPASKTSAFSSVTTEPVTTESTVISETTSATAVSKPVVSEITSSVTNFGTTTGSTTTTATSTPVFGTTTTPSAFAPTTSSSIFGTNVFTATTQVPTFGQASPSVTQASTFGQTSPSVTQVSGFGQTSPPVTQVSTFGQTSPSVTQVSAFGQTSPPVTQVSTFGQTSPPVTQASTFGQTSSPVTQVSTFGQTSSPVTQASTFGQTASVFGAPTTQTSIFGTTPAPIFGTAATQSTVFGTSTTTTQASVFGSSQGTQASVFGTPTTQTSVFGTPNQTTQASIFGTPTQTTQASVFGTPTQTTQTSVFGTPTQGTQASSVFGTPTTTQSGSLFGGAEANLFAAASISTTNAVTPSSGGSIFGGGGSSTGSVFGASGGNVFGGKSTFGQNNSSAASIFGGGGGSTGFGQSTDQQKSWNFWAAGANSNSFGSSGFGQTATTQSSSIFGGTTGGSFSAPSAGAFGTPQQTPFGSQSPKPSVFGSPQQQTSPAFGGSPSFGSKPVFGQAPGFGSQASGSFGGFGGFNKSPTSAGFGGPASFGTSTFSGNAFNNTSPGFGSPTQSNATFENLATQNTMTFGNLAQQAQQPQPQAPGFNASPSFTEWRG